jgi:hypothetical protein
VVTLNPITYKADMNINLQGLLLITLLAAVEGVDNIHSYQLKFPDAFLFGAATSAYQIEGAWNETGKFQFKYFKLRHLLRQPPVKPKETNLAFVPITGEICHGCSAYFREIRTKYRCIQKVNVHIITGHKGPEGE